MLKKKTKKAQGLVEVFAWFLAVFFTILFFILFNLPSCKGPPEQKMISHDLTGLKVNYDLGAYLQTPVTYSGVQLTVADLIVLAIENESTRDSLITSDTSFYINDLDPPEIGIAFAQYFSRITNYPLSIAAANLMKTYSDYFPASANRKWICSYNIYAVKGNEEIILYDSRYSWYDQLSCTKGPVLANAKIPSIEGDIIDVQITVTIDAAKVAATTAARTLVLATLGIY